VERPAARAAPLHDYPLSADRQPLLQFFTSSMHFATAGGRKR